MKEPWWKKIDWKNPRIIILSSLIVILPIAAFSYVKMGLFVGLILAAGLIWLLEKSPRFIKRWAKKHRFLSDLLLSVTSTMMIGSWFGTGLTLAISAFVCALTLSWALPKIK